MTLRRMGRKVEKKFGGQVAELLGLQTQPVKTVFGDLGEGAAWGDSSTGTITVDRGWWKGATRADRRGMLLHELAHTYGAGDETSADLARYALNPKEAAYWKPSEEVLAMANQTGVNGPRPERTTGRSRDTVVNNASKAPPVSPGTAVSLGDQSAQGTYQYLQQLALLKQDLAAARVGKQDAFAQARADRVAGMAGAVNSALDRGMLGSSVDLNARAGVVAGQESAQQAAIRAFQAAALGVQQGQVDAAAQFSQLQASIANAAAAEQMAALAQAYQDGLYDPAAQARAERTGERPRSRRGLNTSQQADADRYAAYAASGGTVGVPYDPRKAYIAGRYAAGRM